MSMERNLMLLGIVAETQMTSQVTRAAIAPVLKAVHVRGI